MTTPLLRVLDLGASFGAASRRRQALDGIDLSIDRGEIVGLVGESGSGKSVAALSILRLLPRGRGRIDSGSIVWRGGEAPVDLAALPLTRMLPYRGGEIAMVFQEPMTSLNPVFTCGWQIREALGKHAAVGRREVRVRARALLLEVGLREPDRVLRQYPHELSGGMRQRVMIAMALACDPKLLICDEITTALDVTTEGRILALISRLREERGTAVLFITHDLGVVFTIADRVAILCPGHTIARIERGVPLDAPGSSRGGRIVEVGDVDEILENPRHPYTQGLLACRPPLDRRMDRLPTVEGFLSDLPPQAAPAARETAGVPFREDAAPLLRLRGVRTYYPSRRGWIKAVDGVDLSVSRGRTIGVVGESGCGKSTLGRTVVRLEEPRPGSSIRYGDREIRDLSRRALTRRMQIVFQDPASSLNPRRTVGSAVTEAMKIHGLHGTRATRRDRAVFLLERVGLTSDALPRTPREFSGGQRQRIAIARALAVEPEFLVLDECVSSLDVSVQAEILNLLMDLQRDLGLTYLFVSHDLAVIRQVSDSVAVMASDRTLADLAEGTEREHYEDRNRGGHIVECGPADRLFESPEHPYTRSLLASVPNA